MEFVSLAAFFRAKPTERVGAGWVMDSGRAGKDARQSKPLPAGPLGGPGTVYALQLLEVLAVNFRIGTEEVKVCAQWLPLALRLHLLFGQLVAFAFVNVQNVDLHVLRPAWQIRENGSPLTEIPDHVAANVAVEDRARQRVLEQDLYHLSNRRLSKTVATVAGNLPKKSTRCQSFFLISRNKMERDSQGNVDLTRSSAREVWLNIA